MTKQERYQKVWHSLEEMAGRPTSAREACVWAVENGLLTMPEVDPLDLMADEMAQALRTEYARDPQGRRYRVNHSVRVTRNGVQMTFWGTMDFAPREHMEKAFAQRREAIVDDCFAQDGY